MLTAKQKWADPDNLSRTEIKISGEKEAPAKQNPWLTLIKISVPSPPPNIHRLSRTSLLGYFCSIIQAKSIHRTGTLITVFSINRWYSGKAESIELYGETNNNNKSRSKVSKMLSHLITIFQQQKKMDYNTPKY